jgi:Bacterial Ig-like domain (group 3)
MFSVVMGTAMCCGLVVGAGPAAGATSAAASHRVAAATAAGGSWGKAQEVPGSAALNAGGAARVSSVSCASAGYCAAGGYYTDSSAHLQAFVVDGTRPTSTSLALSAAKVTYGHEGAERLSVTVTSQYGTPGGKVTVKTGTTTVCTITLASGKGRCTLTASQLRPGTHTLVAAYPGNSDFTSSASSRKTLTVVK